MRTSSRTAVLWRVLVAATCAALASTTVAPARRAAAAAVPEPPPLVPVEVEREVPVPDGVTIPNITNAGTLLADEEHLVAKTTVDGKTQFAVWNIRDGSGLRCITCDILPEASLGDVFTDETRMLVTVGSSDAGGTGDVQYRVLECAPSIPDCATASVVPVRFPRSGGLAVGVQNREMRMHPDDEHIKWNEVSAVDGVKMSIGRLERRPSEYVVTDVRVLNPTYRTGGDSGGWIDGGRFYELGDWLDGGRSVKYGTTTTALNYDVWEIDLATGERRQVTDDLDWNELYDPSAGGGRVAYASARGLDRMDVFTQLVRPPFLDASSFTAIGRVALFNNRRCMNERWLMDRAGQRDGYAGQPVVLDDDWVIRDWSWFADGTRALVFEEELTDGSGPEPEKRIRILHFPTFSPEPPATVVDLDDLDLSWSIPYGAYQGLAGRSYLAGVPGEAGGLALHVKLGILAFGGWWVFYFDWSDDGKSRLSGWESIAGSPLGVQTWAADLRLSGEEEGTLRARLNVRSGGGRDNVPFDGYVTARVDGTVHSGVPTQSDCPGVHQPLLHIEGLSIESGDSAEVDARITAQVPEDPLRRPVTGAQVGVTLTDNSSFTGTTDDDGHVTVPLPDGHADVASVEATAGTFASAVVSP